MEGGRNDSDHRNCDSLKKVLTKFFRLVRHGAGELRGVCAGFSVTREDVLNSTPYQKYNINQ